MSYETEKLTSLQDFARGLERAKGRFGDRIYVTVENQAVATFSDGADGYALKKLKVAVDPVQDLHGYDNPWPGGGLANHLAFPYSESSKTSGNVSYTVENDGSLKIASTAAASAHLDFYFVGKASTYEYAGLEDGTYTFTVRVSSAVSTLQMFVVDEDSNILIGSDVSGTETSRQFTHDSTKKYRIFVRVTSGSTINTVVRPQIESGNTATAWVPYSNICPISGWTGANVWRTGFNQWDEEWEAGQIDSITGENESSSSRWRSKNYIPVVPNSTYYIASPTGTSSSGLRPRFYNVNKEYIGSNTGGGYANVGSTFIVPDNAYYMRFNPDTSLIPNHDICINFTDSSKNGTYEPGHVAEYDISFPQAAGTVYGGELTINRDGTGTLVVDKATMTIDENFVLSNGPSGNLEKGRFNIAAPNLFRKFGTSYSTDLMISNRLKTWTNRDGVDLGSPGITGETRQDYAHSNWIYFGNGVDTTEAGMRTWLESNPIHVVYKLKDSDIVSYTLTASQVTTLLGLNNVWADTGDVKELIYPADTKLFIEKLTQPTEDDMTANSLINANTFFMIGNSLYYSTSQILAGSPIKPGTNCTALSLADALNNLNT